MAQSNFLEEDFLEHFPLLGASLEAGLLLSGHGAAAEEVPENIAYGLQEIKTFLTPQFWVPFFIQLGVAIYAFARMSFTAAVDIADRVPDALKTWDTIVFLHLGNIRDSHAAEIHECWRYFQSLAQSTSHLYAAYHQQTPATYRETFSMVYDWMSDRSAEMATYRRKIVALYRAAHPEDFTDESYATMQKRRTTHPGLRAAMTKIEREDADTVSRKRMRREVDDADLSDGDFSDSDRRRGRRTGKDRKPSTVKATGYCKTCKVPVTKDTRRDHLKPSCSIDKFSTGRNSNPNYH